MRATPETRLEDLGPKDYVAVQCLSCDHTNLLTGDRLKSAGVRDDEPSPTLSAVSVVGNATDGVGWGLLSGGRGDRRRWRSQNMITRHHPGAEGQMGKWAGVSIIAVISAFIACVDVTAAGMPVAQDSWVCLDVETMARIVTLLQDGDQVATSKALASANAAKKCITLKKGQEVYVDGYADGLVKLRPAGEIEGYWASPSTIIAIDQAQPSNPPPPYKPTDQGAPPYKPTDQRAFDRLINNQR